MHTSLTEVDRLVCVTWRRHPQTTERPILPCINETPSTRKQSRESLPTKLASIRCHCHSFLVSFQTLSLLRSQYLLHFSISWTGKHRLSNKLLPRGDAFRFQDLLQLVP